MRVTVTPRVVAGTERGGEDLYLDFLAYHDGDTPPVDEPAEVLLYVVDDWEGLTEVRDLTGDEPDEAYLPGLRVYYRTCYYDFEWEGTGEEAFATEFRDYVRDGNGQTTVVTRKVEDVFRNPANWSFCHKPGEPPRLRCCFEYLHDGNAE